MRESLTRGTWEKTRRVRVTKFVRTSGRASTRWSRAISTPMPISRGCARAAAPAPEVGCPVASVGNPGGAPRAFRRLRAGQRRSRPFRPSQPPPPRVMHEILSARAALLCLGTRQRGSLMHVSEPGGDHKRDWPDVLRSRAHSSSRRAAAVIRRANLMTDDASTPKAPSI